MTSSQNVRSPGAGEGPGGRTCTIDGCDKPVKGRHMCSKHYARFMRHGDPHYVTPPSPKQTCTVDGCGRQAKTRDLCASHYKQLVRNGTVVAEPFQSQAPPDSCVDCGAPPMPGGCFRCEMCLRRDLAARVSARRGGSGMKTARPDPARPGVPQVRSPVFRGGRPA